MSHSQITIGANWPISDLHRSKQWPINNHRLSQHPNHWSLLFGCCEDIYRSFCSIKTTLRFLWAVWAWWTVIGNWDNQFWILSHRHSSGRECEDHVSSSLSPVSVSVYIQNKSGPKTDPWGTLKWVTLNLSMLCFRNDPGAIIKNKLLQSSMPGVSKCWIEDLVIHNI